ncbi:MAG: hypothetical protein ABW252_03725 [Polyangiales bacterium]
MFDASRLVLLIGPPALPVPAPLPLVEALQRVEVDSSVERTGFQLTFTVGKSSPLQLAMLPVGLLDPIATRVVLVMIHTGIPHVLADGIVVRHQLTPSNQAGQSTLTLTGEDLTVLMDLVEVRAPYPAMDVMAQANLILAKYAAFGIMPATTPPLVPTLKRPTDRFDQQTGTDLAYLRGLARQCGYAFYLRPGPVPCASRAYFGPNPSPLDLSPMPALSINGDADTNVDQLSFAFDGMKSKVRVVSTLDPVTRKILIPIPVPSVNPLRPPLGARMSPPAKLRFSNDTASLPPDELANRVLGDMAEDTDAVTASGSLNVARYGHMLKAGGIVGVRGAGLTYDGLYYVDNVNHSIKPGEHTQSFRLSRDGLVSPTPVVPP